MVDWNKYGNIRSPSRNRLLFPEHKLTTEAFIDYFKDIDTRFRVLDAGCGDGFWMEILRNLGFINLTGLDLSQSMLKKARKKGFNVIESNIESARLRCKFDVIIMCDVLEHIEDTGGVLANLRDMLENWGILYLVIPVYDSVHNRFKRLFRGEKKMDQAKNHDETHIHGFSRGEIFQLLDSEGFLVEKAVYTGNRLPMLSGKIQKFTFGNRFGNWLSISAKMAAPTSNNMPVFS